MKWKMGTRIIPLGFALATSMLVLVGWLSLREENRFVEAAQWREHTYLVVNSLNETVALLSDAETGQRGFLLTGDETYLEPYKAATRSIDRTVLKLNDLTSDNSRQHNRIQKLEPLIEERLGELKQTIELRRSKGLAAVTSVVQEGTGKQTMDQIRTLIAEMTSEETALLKTRRQQTEEGATRSTRTIVAGTLVSIALLVMCFALLNRQLSERKLAQRSLARNEKWLSTTLSSIGDSVIATDMNGTVSFLNPVAQKLTGRSLEEARGKSMDMVFDILNAETRRPVENPVKKVFREGKIVDLADHTILLSKDGREFDIEDSAAPIVSESGETLGVVLVFRDITETKAAETETKRQKDLLELILSSMSDGVVVADKNGKFLLFNPAAEQILGLGATDATPDQWAERYGVYHPDGLTHYAPMNCRWRGPFGAKR